MTDAGAERCGRLASEWTTIDGRRWHVRVSVDPVPAGAPPFVLVHGLGVSSRYLIPTARALAPHFRTYAPDLPGFGKSDEPDGWLGVHGLAEALAGWMGAMGIGRAVLLGNSLGCQVIVDLAARRPDHVLAAVLVGPTGDPRARSLAQYAWRLLLDLPREPFALDLIQAQDYLRAGPWRTLRTARSMVRDRVAETLPLVRQPTLVVRGGRDPIVPQRWAKEATRLLPRGRLVEVPGAAHVVNYTAPQDLVRAVCAFLADAGIATSAPMPGDG